MPTPTEPPELNYDAQGLIPAIVQDDETGEVLMLAYMNRDSLRMTVEKGYTHFWSRSRRKFWMKGESSGHVQEVREIAYDCDRDTLLVRVIQHGPGACHTGHRSCFFTRLDGVEKAGPAFSAEEAYAGQPILERLGTVIHDRRLNPREGSYVSALFARGREAVLKKVGEEATEVVVAAAAGGKEGKERLVAELADLWFHCLVLMEQEGLTLDDVYGELERRAARAQEENDAG